MRAIAPASIVGGWPEPSRSCLEISGLTHRESYFDMVMTVIVTCLIALGAVLLLGSVFGSF